MESDEDKEAAAAKEAAAVQKETTAAKRAYILALAGAVVAVVGVVVGAGSSWLVSREDRSNQRALAHEARAYERRANAYLEALSLFQPVAPPLGRAIQVGGRPREPVFPSRKVIRVMLTRLDRVDSRLRFTLLAFGTPRALIAYQNAWSAARHAYQDADEVWDFFPPGLDTKPEVALSELPLSTGSRADFLKVQSRYKQHTRSFSLALGSLIDSAHKDIG